MGLQVAALRDSKNSPAPNTYSLTDYQVKVAPSVSLKFRHERSITDAGPAPHDYADKDFTRPSCEGKSFGTSRDSAWCDNGMPGPGTHDPDERATRRRPKSWSMSRSARSAGNDNGVPGAGTYMPHRPVFNQEGGHGVRSDQRSAPSYTIAGRKYIPGYGESPGPLDYGRPKDSMSRSYPAFSFRGVTAKDTRRKDPGPGAYDAWRGDSVVRASAPAFSLALKNEALVAGDGTPGPNEYYPQLDTKPGVSLKFRHEHDGKDPGPGPGSYSHLQTIYCPGSGRKGFSFGVKPKSRTADTVPGPIYETGCTTLGIAAAIPMTRKEMNQIAVL